MRSRGSITQWEYLGFVANLPTGLMAQLGLRARSQPRAYSQAWAARELGVNRTYLSLVLNGHRQSSSLKGRYEALMAMARPEGAQTGAPKAEGEFGEVLRSLMARDGLNQTELASKANISQAAISRYLKENRVPKTAILKRIAAVFGMEPILAMQPK